MHAKVTLVDEEILLVASANFTFHGLTENSKTGVRLWDVSLDRSQGYTSQTL